MPNSITDTRRMGQAMLQSMLAGSPDFVHENSHINALAK